ncbi:hypothetical protein NIES21_51910 [Anabaenopsis circularis NIES-21]|uniref:Uncharacterized protein n=1 Tax=Anabaenopsis circularis NIES-21 TaxID=1085406 RepID=A0A1Z4GPA8_9CYAN|nr:hypothetical protein NIES21_51910 [Anabaenopsis circularis NIES-21]
MIQQKLSCNYPTSQFAITNWHNVKTEVATACAKHANAKAEVATACAKHANVKAEVTTRKVEVATAYAKHANVKAEVTTGNAEVAIACAKHANVKAEVKSLALKFFQFHSRSLRGCFRSGWLCLSALTDPPKPP